jgi:cobalt-zinc-cadmium efflux system outer membrane protein
VFTQATMSNLGRVGRSGVPIALLGTALTLSCVHYEAKPIGPRQSLTTIEARTTDDGQLRSFLAKHGAGTAQSVRWDLRALTLIAFYYHPALDEARAAADVARGAIVTAGARPNPTAQPTIGYDTTTPPPWMPGFGLLIPIETAGKRGHRIAGATRLAEAAQLQIIATAWHVRVGVRRSLLEVVIARRQQQLLGRQLAVQDTIVELFQRQLEAGAITPFEATQARLAAATTRLAVNQAGVQRALAEAALTDAIGLTRESFSEIAQSVDLGEELNTQIPEQVVRRQALVSRSDVRAALAEYEASQAALQLEIARQYPDIELGPGYLFDQTDNKWTLGVGVTLPILNRNQGPIAEAAARREQAAAHLMVVQANALHELSEAEAVLQATRLKLTTAEAALTTTQEQEQRRQRMYDVGDISRVELLTAQLETAAAEVAVGEARAQVDRAAGALEDAIQSPLGFEDAVLTNPRKTESTPERQQP